MFTQQHFNQLAALICAERNEIVLTLPPQSPIPPSVTQTDGRIYETRVIATRLADLFAADNPRFQRERFLKACGLD
jgi:hypothetical protein